MDMNKEPNLSINEVLGEYTNNPKEDKQSGFPVHIKNEKKEPTGEVIYVSSLEQRIKAQYEIWMLKEASREVEEMESILSNPESMTHYRAAFLKEKAEGKYKWDGENTRSSLRSIKGIMHLVFLLVSRCHRDMTKERLLVYIRDNQEQFRKALEWAMSYENGGVDDQGELEAD